MRILLTIIVLNLLIYNAFSQQILLKGKIVSSTRNEAVSSVNIFIPKAKLGTISDDNGAFSIEISSANSNDTIIFSSIGYKPVIENLNKLNPKGNLLIELDDSLFLLNEVKAICFDNVDALKWQSKKEKESKMMFSFATRKLDNVANYINLLKEAHGYTKLKGNSLKWKGVHIPGLKNKVQYHLSFFRCPYCPDEENVVVTIDIKDSKGVNLAESSVYKPIVKKHFQQLLDKTFAQGIDHNQLEKRLEVMYLKKATEPYSGHCYGYFENGQKGLRGTYEKGLRNGYWEFWYSNGNKKIEGEYLNGQKHGKWKYFFEDGSVRMDAQYINDNMDGVNIWYHENGRKKKEATFKNGIFIEKTEWDENGKITLQTHYLK